ncbi:MAG: sulfotransferase [Cryomorphaceae bacterium]|nr:hypothetical protein [Flavobacteriales bacterium]
MSQSRSSKKIFCIGLNKTGTTSLKAFMQIHGYAVGDQAAGELLISNFEKNNYEPLYAYCETAQFFQDLPFSIPGMAKNLLKQYPDASYILTKRSSAEAWYNSLVDFHKKLFGENKRIPTKADLIKAGYRYPGFAWEANRLLYPSPEDAPYRKDDLKAVYENHIRTTRELFSNRENFLELNIENDDSVSKLASFLHINPQVDRMPWKNKTSEL